MKYRICHLWRWYAYNYQLLWKASTPQTIIKVYKTEKRCITQEREHARKVTWIWRQNTQLNIYIYYPVFLTRKQNRLFHCPRQKSTKLCIYLQLNYSQGRQQHTYLLINIVHRLTLTWVDWCPLSMRFPLEMHFSHCLNKYIFTDIYLLIYIYWYIFTLFGYIFLPVS